MVRVTSWSLAVGGQKWLVRDRSGQPGVYDFDWLTGPAQYGFTFGSSNGSPIDEEFMTSAIADFLAQTDPKTGYLE